VSALQGKGWLSLSVLSSHLLATDHQQNSRPLCVSATWRITSTPAVAFLHRRRQGQARSSWSSTAAEQQRHTLSAGETKGRGPGCKPQPAANVKVGEDCNQVTSVCPGTDQQHTRMCMCLPTDCNATAADVLASSTRSSSSSSSPVAVDASVEEAVHIVEESLHERAAVSVLGEGLTAVCQARAVLSGALCVSAWFTGTSPLTCAVLCCAVL
jgi:hypothetical protein